MATGEPETIAARLIAEFGSLSAVLAGSAGRLRRCVPDERDVIVHLRDVRLAMVQALRAELDDRPLITNWQALIRYLRADMAALAWERVRVFHLDVAHRLIRDEVTCDGTVDEVALHPATILRRAIELGSAGIIVAHNHPSGNPDPSKADIAVTRRLCEGAEAIGVVVQDHIIVAGMGESSMRQMGLL